MTATTTVSADWVRGYLNLLDVEPTPPSLAALEVLTRAQILTVAFENITSLLRRAANPEGAVPPVDLDALLDNWVKRRGGGVCFELAPMFCRLLTALGYRATLILGQISFPGSHQAVLVELDGARYLADVSNGAPFFSPIPLDRVTEIRTAGLAFRFRPGDAPDRWVQDRYIHEEWTPFCRYNLNPAAEDERTSGYQGHHTPGQSWVVDRLRLVRCDETYVASLTDEELVHFTADGKTTERLSGPADFSRVAADLFRVPGLPIGEALRIRGLSPVGAGVS
jgi:N-hydroxyarylamine O-acetyltransferase